jgi:hypothetical protein
VYEGEIEKEREKERKRKSMYARVSESVTFPGKGDTT